jgi:outer membrane receptor protein involved in Fe transport
MAEIRFEPRLTKSVQLMLRAHANRQHTEVDLAHEPEPIETTKEYYKGTWFGAEARISYTPRPQMRLVMGVEGQLHPEARLSGAEPNSEPYLDVDDRFRFGATYVLFEGTLLPWLRISTGARADIYRFGPILVPRAAVILRPSQKSTLKVIGGRAFRTPSIYELYYSDGGITRAAAVQVDLR